MADTKETVKDSEVKQQLRSGVPLPDYKAVIRPKKANKLIVPGLGEYDNDNPIHTNNDKLIKGCKANGNISGAENTSYKSDAKAPKK